MFCKIGDGKGGYEKQIKGSYTRQQCIEAVQKQYPEANGVTVSNPCHNDKGIRFVPHIVTHNVSHKR